MAALARPRVLAPLVLGAALAAWLVPGDRMRGEGEGAASLPVWTGFGLLTYAASRGLRSLDAGFFAWDRAGPWIAGGAVAAAGLYQLTPLKAGCLRHCPPPLHFVLHGW